jgi:hypothetical protein
MPDSGRRDLLISNDGLFAPESGALSGTATRKQSIRLNEVRVREVRQVPDPATRCSSGKWKSFSPVVRPVLLAPGQTQPAPDDWLAIEPGLGV